MTIARSGNMYYLTASDDPASIAQNNIRVKGIILDATAAGAIVELGENNSGRSYPTVFTYRNDTSEFLNFAHSPLLFPSGIRVKTVTNANVTLILDTNKEQ